MAAEKKSTNQNTTTLQLIILKNDNGRPHISRVNAGAMRNLTFEPIPHAPYVSVLATLRMIETRGAEGVGIMILKNCTLMHTCLILPIDFVHLQLTIFTLIGSVTAFYNFYNFNYK